MIRRTLRRRSSGRARSLGNTSFNSGRGRAISGVSLFRGAVASAKVGTRIKPRSWIYHSLKAAITERKRLEDARRLVEGR